MAPKEIREWCEIIRSHWIAPKPSGTLFRSRDVFSWVAEGNVELVAGDFKPVSASGRQYWRDRLSKALKKLHDNGELLHPGISSHAWKVP